MGSSPQGSVPCQAVPGTASGKAPLSTSSHSPASAPPSFTGTPLDAHGGGDELSPQRPFCWATGFHPQPEPATGHHQGHLGHEGTAPLGPAGEERSRSLPRVLQCSATCGVGAIWRTVRCSTGSDDGCAAANKPVPARRCSLRPCSSWRVGNWSKVNRRAEVRKVPKNPQKNEGRWCVPCGWSSTRSRGVLLPHGSQRQRAKFCTCHRVQTTSSHNNVFIFPALALVKKPGICKR